MLQFGINKLKNLNSRKYKITGEATVQKGLKNKPIEYDAKGNVVQYQGRINDTKLILKPLIEVLK